MRSQGWTLFALFETDDLGERNLDYSMAGAGPQVSKRFARVIDEVELKAGSDVGTTKLLNLVIAPLSNGSDFPAAIAAVYRSTNSPRP